VNLLRHRGSLRWPKRRSGPPCPVVAPQALQHGLTYSVGIAFATTRDFDYALRDDLLHGRRLALVMQFSTSFVEGLANECRRLRIEGSIRDLKGLFRRRDG
jgi:hypothetical protein